MGIIDVHYSYWQFFPFLFVLKKCLQLWSDVLVNGQSLLMHEKVKYSPIFYE
jgi:hypothetical protein